MKSRVYHSSNDVLFLALEELYTKLREDEFLDDFDFIIFAVSPKYNPKDINRTIQRVFNTSNYLAFNAINAFSNDKVVEGVVGLFIKFERDGEIIINEPSKNDLNLIFLPYKEGLEEEKILDSISYLSVGGIASGERAYLYYNGEIIKDNFITLTFKNVDYRFGISLGYKPIGPTYKVQVAKGNRVYVINYEDASLIAKRLLKNLDNDIKNLWYSPVTIISKKGYVDFVRTFKDIKENEYVEFFGNIEAGDMLKLSFATEKMLLEEDKKVALNLREKLDYIDLAFNFSCVAREYVLGKYQEKEPKIYSQILNAPLFGFFTYGEIGPNFDFSSVRLYNQTSLVVALKEK